ncbi:ABC transporter substrate-binding protein [Fodinicola acaciae]|uniref:ABC transporter substrate-binding protein n=1 Tax=Fodinicola acaciae TaxID=2681555 RepID=UPI0013D61D8E|nr:extracellular solute-binding protein [Fodinicola acaciae]
MRDIQSRPLSRRTFLSATALGLGAAAGLSACGGGGGSGSGTISFWKTPVGDLAFEQSYNKKLIADFTAKQKDTKVNFLVIPWDSALPKYTAGYAGSNPPDLAYEILPWMNKFRGTGALADLRKLGGSAVDKYFQNVPQGAIDGATGKNGERYAVPFSAGHFGLTLNEEIWEKAGKPPLPVTYDDIIPFAQKLTFDKAGKRLGEAGFNPKNIAHWGMTWAGTPGAETNYVWNYLWAYGADIVSKDGKDIGFAGDEGRAALQNMKKLVDSGGATPMGLYSDQDAWGDLMLQGKAGLQWMPNISPIQEQKYKTRFRAIDLPKGPAGTFVVGGCGYYSIASKSKNKKAAYSLLEFMFDDARRKDYIRSIRVYPFGDPPADYYAGVGDKRVEAYLTTVAAQTKYVRLTPVLPFDPQDYILGKFNDYFLGRTSLDDMLKDTSAHVKQLASTVR